MAQPARPARPARRDPRGSPARRDPEGADGKDATTFTIKFTDPTTGNTVTCTINPTVTIAQGCNVTTPPTPGA